MYGSKFYCFDPDKTRIDWFNDTVIEALVFSMKLLKREGLVTISLN